MTIDNNTDSALKKLVCKYKVEAQSRFNLLPGWRFLQCDLNDNDVPLLTWRVNRKFTELQKIISDQIVENVSMLRFSSMGNKKEWSLEALMYREFDICEFLIDSKITSLHATFSDNSAGSVIVKLANGVIGSIEIGIQSPVEKQLIDRHEIIARRGVASDIVVDTQIPQSSIYTYTDKGKLDYKDIDNELFGLDEFQVEWVRSAFEFHKKPEKLQELIKQHNHLSSLVSTALESNSKKLKIEVI